MHALQLTSNDHTWRADFRFLTAMNILLCAKSVVFSKEEKTYLRHNVLLKEP